MGCCSDPKLMDGEDGAFVCFNCYTVSDTPLEEELAHEKQPCCSNPNISADRRNGDYVCLHCGVVSEEGVSEYYVYDEDGTKTHVERGIAGNSRQVVRGVSASKWNMIALTGRDKIMLNSLHMLSQNQLPQDFHHDILRVFDSLNHTPGMMRGKDTSLVVAALLYVAMKDQAHPHTIQECASYVNASVKKFSKVLRFVEGKLPRETVQHGTGSSSTLLAKISSVLDLSAPTKKKIQVSLGCLSNIPIGMYTKLSISIYHNTRDANTSIEEICKLVGSRKQTVVKTYEMYKSALGA